MPFNYSSGLRNSESYKSAGSVWMTGSIALAIGETHRIKFPTVAKSVTIRNHRRLTRPIFVFFASGSNPVGDDQDAEHFKGEHYWQLSSHGAALTMDTKCTEVYIYRPTVARVANNAANGGTGANTTKLKTHRYTSGDDGLGYYQVIAELTSIPSGSMFPLTGSGLTTAGLVAGENDSTLGLAVNEGK